METKGHITANDIFEVIDNSINPLAVAVEKIAPMFEKHELSDEDYAAKALHRFMKYELEALHDKLSDWHESLENDNCPFVIKGAA